MAKTITKPGKDKPVKKTPPKKKDVPETPGIIEAEVVKEENIEVMEPTTGAISVPIRKETPGVALTTLEDLSRFSQAIAKSGMFPGIQDQFQALAVIEMGREIGLKPMIALQVIDVIPTKRGGVLYIRGRALAALAKESGINIEVLRKDTKGCQLKFSRGNEPPHTASFTEDDAKRAGLLSKDNYMNYPEDQYYWRAIARGLKVFAPGLALGLDTAEEIADGLPDLITKDKKGKKEKPEKEQPTVVITKEKPGKVEEPPKEEAPDPEPPPEEPKEPDTSSAYAIEFEDTIKEIKMRLEKAEIKEQRFKKYLHEELQPLKPDRSFVDINKHGHLSFHHGKLDDLKIILSHFDWFCGEYVASKTFEESAKDTPPGMSKDPI